ncbi:MAG: RidA family protein [Chloroflexi bacterium]|nr:RidA family protein [Chloroflexota bacterium]
MAIIPIITAEPPGGGRCSCRGNPRWLPRLGRHGGLPPHTLAGKVTTVQKTKVIASAAPAPIGPYSQAIKVGNLVFVAGQGPANPATRKVESQDIQDQTRQTLENVRAILTAAGTSMDNVVKTTCFLRDMNDFARFNEVYATFFGDPYPARTTIQAARLPGDIGIEIEVVAILPA